MYITPANLSFGSGSYKLKISNKQKANANNLYLYNKSMSVINKYKLPALITNRAIVIEFSEPKFQSDLIKSTKKALKTSGVFYEAVK